MKAGMLFCASAICFGSQSLADDSTWSYVGKWVDECIQTVPDEDEIAANIYSDCIGVGYRYCRFDEEVADHAACVSALTNYLLGATAKLVDEKPDTSGLSKYRAQAFEAYWNEAVSPPDIAFCETAVRPSDNCSEITAALRYRSAHAAWRLWRLEAE